MIERVDRFRDRFQVQIGGRWDLMPGKGDTWRQWAFSPYYGLTRIGQRYTTGVRSHLPPDGPSMAAMIDIEDVGVDPETKLKISNYISRIFWLRFGCRVVGLDLGIGIYFRRKFDKWDGARKP